MELIRILHVVSSLNKSSGIMSVIMNWYRHINRENVQFDFLYGIEKLNSYKDEIQAMGGRVYYFPMPRVITYFSFKAGIRVFFISHEKEFKVVHLHEILLGNIILPLAKKYGIQHLIIHSHSTKFSSIFLKSIRNRLLCLRLNRKATLYFACSRQAGIFLFGRKHVRNDDIHIVHNAIDCCIYRYNPLKREEIREELGIKNNLVIGHVGRFSTEKNHIFLIKVFENIISTNKNAKLLLVGDGPLVDVIVEEVKKKGIEEAVIFYGKSNKVHDLLQAMDVFVLPSFFEGLPVVLVEAQAAGVPCVVSDTVSEEAKLVNDLWVGCSLKQSIQEWIGVIVEVSLNSRKDTYLEIRKKGYDINDATKVLEDFYLSLK